MDGSAWGEGLHGDRRDWFAWRAERGFAWRGGAVGDGSRRMLVAGILLLPGRCEAARAWRFDCFVLVSDQHEAVVPMAVPDQV